MMKLLLILLAVVMSLSAKSAESIMKKNNCFTCHDVSKRKKAPAFKKVAKKNQKKFGEKAKEHLIESLKNGSRGQYRYYGNTSMPAYDKLSKSELNTISTWILNFNNAKKKKSVF